MQSLIEIKNLKHSYIDTDGNEIHALNGVSLDIYKGEFIAVIGANGSGKSTLARHLNALLLPTEGKCIVAGMVLRTIKIYGIYASMSVWFFKILTTRLLRQSLRRMWPSGRKISACRRQKSAPGLIMRWQPLA